MINRKWAAFHILWKAVSSHVFLWLKGSEWYYTLGSVITPFPMTNSKWVAFHIWWKAVSSPVPITKRKWVAFHICESHCHHISFYDQQAVSSIPHFVKSLITLFPMTKGSEWGSTFVKGGLIKSFLWPTVCECHCTFCERWSDHVFSYDQQLVSDIAHFVKGSLITFFPMTNRKWVTLHILVWSHLLQWPTACEWHCTFCERQSDHAFTFSYDQQQVSDIAHVVRGSLITSVPMTKGSEWQCGIAHFVKGSLITYFPITKRKWVALHILWKAVSSHIFLSPKAVSSIAHFVNSSLIT